MAIVDKQVLQQVLEILTSDDNEVGQSILALAQQQELLNEKASLPIYALSAALDNKYATAILEEKLAYGSLPIKDLCIIYLDFSVHLRELLKAIDKKLFSLCKKIDKLNERQDQNSKKILIVTKQMEELFTRRTRAITDFLTSKSFTELTKEDLLAKKPLTLDLTNMLSIGGFVTELAGTIFFGLSNKVGKAKRMLNFLKRVRAEKDFSIKEFTVLTDDYGLIECMLVQDKPGLYTKTILLVQPRKQDYISVADKAFSLAQEYNCNVLLVDNRNLSLRSSSKLLTYQDIIDDYLSAIKYILHSKICSSGLTIYSVEDDMGIIEHLQTNSFMLEQKGISYRVEQGANTRMNFLDKLTGSLLGFNKREVVTHDNVATIKIKTGKRTNTSKPVTQIKVPTKKN